MGKFRKWSGGITGSVREVCWKISWEKTKRISRSLKRC